MSQALINELRERLHVAANHYVVAADRVLGLQKEIQESEAAMYAASDQARAFAETLRAMGEADEFHADMGRRSFGDGWERIKHRRVGDFFDIRSRLDSLERSIKGDVFSSTGAA